MLSRKTMIKGQKMQDYLEVYNELLDIIEEYLGRSMQENNPSKKRLFRKLADETGIALCQITERALNDNKIWG